ncbi:ATP-binding protein [Emticicia sp. 21SJ11W-3]|uniref:ATP-binding protein n=1 Tax=Emticicia sp. 21SJ11W-3 TaxID=2916755 RepID=UPI0020A1157F|nr:ATP-binding protein [Emticicia sp. 21SJ11W-3]UTA67694.1 ATP-binding protein [Emticicia sp. 21SJ11W-3]
MALKDIVNRELVNLTNCEQEPIHIPGSIQPHGFLVATDTNGVIRYCSANIHEFTPFKAENLLQQPIEVLIGADQLSQFRHYLTELQRTSAAPHILGIGNTQFQCMVHQAEDTFLCEFEPVSEHIPRVSAVYDQAINFARYMSQAMTLQQLCHSVATEIRALTGYDRVMVYRFDKQYNGEIFAESKVDEHEPFLGLHYPHTDIPVQARQLYIRNLMRLIVDVNYTPVPILTKENSSNKDLDLSCSTLRSVSPIHVQYLKNIGVSATLTISLLHEGKLWGLIACHHYSAKYLDHYTRITAQLQGHFLTSQIQVREMAEGYAVAARINTSLETLLNKTFVPERASLQALVNQPQILEICHAAGVAVILNNVVYKAGKTPDDPLILQIAELARQKAANGIFNTSALSEDFPEALEWCSVASGILYYQLGVVHNEAIVWFRPESLQTINWSGDPEKAIMKDVNGLSPRKSFEKYQQIVKCRSYDWTQTELTAAATFSYSIQKLITLILLTEEEARQRELTRQLEASNLELENISWISTHDLKEPLRKIQLFSSRLLNIDKNLSADMSATLQKMNASANKMQKLISDITNYSRIRHSETTLEKIDLAALIDKVKQELAEDIEEKNASVVAVNLAFIEGIPVIVHQLFSNLIGNSMKFIKDGVWPKIVIKQEQEPVKSPEPDDTKLYYKITVADNGIGFENEFSDKIFKIFTRLHSADKYQGTGIGLALCKKVMQLHNGYIYAESGENQGAVFTLYFPV